MAKNFMIKGKEDKREINQEEITDDGKRVHIIGQNEEINHKKKSSRDRLK
jgi:hypothetical protein